MNRLDRITARLLRRRWHVPRVTEREVAGVAGNTLHYSLLRLHVAAAALSRPLRRMLRLVFA